MILEEVKELLCRVLQLDERCRNLQADTPLLGNLPELDSMAVIAVINALEQQFGFTVYDDEISADTFATLGNLAAFVRAKRQAGPSALV